MHCHLRPPDGYAAPPCSAGIVIIASVYVGWAKIPVLFSVATPPRKSWLFFWNLLGRGRGDADAKIFTSGHL